MMLVVLVVTVSKLSLIPVWSSSEHRERKLTQLVARGWLGSRDVAQTPSLLQGSPAQI